MNIDGQEIKDLMPDYIPPFTVDPKNPLKHVCQNEGYSRGREEVEAVLPQMLALAEKRGAGAIEKEVGSFIAGAYAMKFNGNSREAKFWDVWKDGYEQCRKDALNAIKYESRGQD